MKVYDDFYITLYMNATSYGCSCGNCIIKIEYNDYDSREKTCNKFCEEDFPNVESLCGYYGFVVKRVKDQCVCL